MPSCRVPNNPVVEVNARDPRTRPPADALTKSPQRRRTGPRLRSRATRWAWSRGPCSPIALSSTDATCPACSTCSTSRRDTPLRRQILHAPEHIARSAETIDRDRSGGPECHLRQFAYVSIPM
jgi:hypothetical protein